MRPHPTSKFATGQRAGVNQELILLDCPRAPNLVLIETEIGWNLRLSLSVLIYRLLSMFSVKYSVFYSKNYLRLTHFILISLHVYLRQPLIN